MACACIVFYLVHRTPQARWVSCLAKGQTDRAGVQTSNPLWQDNLQSLLTDLWCYLRLYHDNRHSSLRTSLQRKAASDRRLCWMWCIICGFTPYSNTATRTIAVPLISDATANWLCLSDLCDLAKEHIPVVCHQITGLKRSIARLEWFHKAPPSTSCSYSSIHSLHASVSGLSDRNKY